VGSRDGEREAWRLARRQHGVVAIDQLERCGLTWEAVRTAQEAGRLERIHRGVYRVTGAPTTRLQAISAGCLSLGPTALASHATAAALWSFDGIVAHGTELVTPRTVRRERGSLTVHQSTDLRDVDATEHRRIPVTTPTRTLLDLGAVVHPYRLEQALDDAIRRRLVTLDGLFHRFQEVARRGRRGVGPLRPLLEERLGTTINPGSAFEASTLRLVARAGLPRPTCQHLVNLPDTVVYLDLAWPDRLLAVECDSLAHHFGAHRLRWDDRRQNGLVLLGWTIIRLTWVDVTQRTDATVTLLREAWATCRPTCAG
jgi:hypothetical protein